MIPLIYRRRRKRENHNAATRKYALRRGEGALSRFHWHWRFVDARCLMKNDDHGPGGMRPPIIPYSPFVRSRVYTGTRETGSYNHHSQLNRFKGRY